MKPGDLVVWPRISKRDIKVKHSLALVVWVDNAQLDLDPWRAVVLLIGDKFTKTFATYTWTLDEFQNLND